jgi:hypothetical protein
MPLLEDKNDFDINLGIRPSDEGDFNLQSAYAPLNHFEVMMNGMTYTSSYGTYTMKHRFLEAGAGVFHAFGNSYGIKPFRLELIGGYGLGVGEKNDVGLRAVGRYQRKFLQPSIGIKMKEFEVSFGVRLAEINFSNYSIYNQRILIEKGILDFTTIEPNFKATVGFKRVKVGFQISSTRAIRNEDAYNIATETNRYDVATHLDLLLCFNPWKYKTQKRENFLLHPEDSSAVNSIEFIISDSPCWICMPKDAAYNDAIEFKLNGRQVDYSAKMSDMICHRLQLSRDLANLLSVSLKNPAQSISTPVNVILIDGKLKRPFYIDLSGDKRMDFYLTY